MTEQEKALRVTFLRETMKLHASGYLAAEAELKELNRPSWIDAKQVLAEMAKREAARRKIYVPLVKETAYPEGIIRVRRVEVSDGL